MNAYMHWTTLWQVMLIRPFYAGFSPGDIVAQLLLNIIIQMVRNSSATARRQLGYRKYTKVIENVAVISTRRTNQFILYVFVTATIVITTVVAVMGSS